MILAITGELLSVQSYCRESYIRQGFLHHLFYSSRQAGFASIVLNVHVQVPMFSASGLRVQYLKVWEKSNYKVEKWVRKVSKSGDYSTRI